MTDRRLCIIRQHIKSFPDFPSAGIVFQDLFSVLLVPEAFQALNEVLVERAALLRGQVDAVVGLDARGFLLGPMLALQLAVPFVPVRKAGKLPGACHRVDYGMEYGRSSIEMQVGSLKPGQKVLIVDDLLATGGSLEAAMKLVDASKAETVQCLVVIELLALSGRQKLEEATTVTSLLQL